MPRRIVALHEAAHAVAAAVLHRPLHRVSIVSRGDILGRCYPGSRAFSRRALDRDRRMVRRLEDEVIVLLAARAAELRAGWHSPAGDSNDRIWAGGLAARVCSTRDEWAALLRLSRIRARQLVDRYWRAIDKVAAALEAKSSLSGSAVRALAEPSEVLHVKP